MLLLKPGATEEQRELVHAPVELNPGPRQVFGDLRALPGLYELVLFLYYCKHNSTDMYNAREAHYETFPGTFPNIEMDTWGFSVGTGTGTHRHRHRHTQAQAHTAVDG